MSTAESFGPAVGHTMTSFLLLDPETKRYYIVQNLNTYVHTSVHVECFNISELNDFSLLNFRFYIP